MFRPTELLIIAKVRYSVNSFKLVSKNCDNSDAD